MSSETERDAVKGMMELLNTGMQFQPDIAITFKQIIAIYKCGCHGNVQCIPNTKNRSILLVLYCFCQTCKKCSAIPTKLIIYKTEMEFDPTTKKKLSQNPQYRIQVSYEQFEQFYELN